MKKSPRSPILLLLFCTLGLVIVIKAYDWLHTRSEIAKLDENASTYTNRFDNVQHPSPNGFESAASKIMPSVVSIDILEEQQTWEGDIFAIPRGSGSGVIVSDQGYIVTNNHVIDNASTIRVHVSEPHDKKGFISKPYKAKVVGIDERSDLAVLKISAPNLIPANLGSAKQLRIGDWVMAVGNPLGFSNTLSVGVVSNIGRNLPTEGSVLTHAIQTDASINQGNSGGALANKYGELVGINTVIASKSGGSIGIGFAIPVERVKSVIEDIYKHGKVKYGWFGVSVYQPEMFMIKQNRMKMEQMIQHKLPKIGLVVRFVHPRSPAYEEGIRPYGVITAIDGEPMDDMFDYLIALSEKKPGDIVNIDYWQAGVEKRLKITLANPLH